MPPSRRTHSKRRTSRPVAESPTALRLFSGSLSYQYRQRAENAWRDTLTPFSNKPSLDNHDRVKIRAMAKKLPADVLAYFRKQGAKGGRIGGPRALETMTPEARVARAKKASAAAAAARKLSANKTKRSREGGAHR